MVEETLTLVGVGSSKVASSAAYVLVPDHFSLLPEGGGSVDLVGLVEDLSEPRWMYKVQGPVAISADDELYFVQTDAQSEADERLLWKEVAYGFIRRRFRCTRAFQSYTA
ncbi:hypothetical protein H0I39_09135 [Ottowia beijingensis]|uniref:Uncharacterized protein n=1 Tax=Ottowia beijingensis TaxID=1207057 RepID=A0A853IV84_9BURK|nr:hypothetical protein [Ottowia beijingensis]NZA01881.1 hypothetical protein [Ottowia beijingensis]